MSTPEKPSKSPAAAFGCLPAFVFVLVLVMAAGVYVLRKHPEVLPQTPVGKVTMEISGHPSDDEMKRHAAVARMDGTLQRMAAALGLDKTWEVPIDEAARRFGRMIEIDVCGPMLTLEVFHRDPKEAAVWANGAAEEFHDLLRADKFAPNRGLRQTLQTTIKISEDLLDQAQVAYLEAVKRSGPDDSPMATALRRETARRLATAELDVALLRDQPVNPPVVEPDKPAPAIVPIAERLAAAERQMKVLQSAAAQQDAAAVDRMTRRVEAARARERLDAETKNLRELREKLSDWQLQAGVPASVSTIREAARPGQKSADRRAVRAVRLAVFVAAAFLIASVLSALVRRWCRN